MKEKIIFATKVGKGFVEFKYLLRSIPSPVVAFFVISVIAMNILANKTIYQSEIIAIDGVKLIVKPSKEVSKV